MKKLTASLAFWALCGIAAPATAHFQELIPSVPIADRASGRDLTIDMRFTHPMARGPVMAMGEPERFGVLTPGGGREDLSDRLEGRKLSGKQAFQASYEVQKPGDYIFYVEPEPYWEPSEGVMITHFTKVVVNAFGRSGDWDRAVGFPVEIKPLTRPYGLWTGNAFQGVVTRDGDPVPHATVEVEWRNDGSVEAPAPAYTTQVIRADANGVFTYAMPRSGWWGFAALMEADESMANPDGEQVPVEQGALIWVHARDME